MTNSIGNITEEQAKKYGKAQLDLTFAVGSMNKQDLPPFQIMIPTGWLVESLS
jgi:hypothetical protein